MLTRSESPALWFSSAYLLRVHFVPVFFILFDLTTSVCPEIETSYFDWAHQSRHPPLLPDDGDRFQSPKRRVFLIIIRRWIISMKFVILTNRHKPSEFKIHNNKHWMEIITVFIEVMNKEIEYITTKWRYLYMQEWLLCSSCFFHRINIKYIFY
jgi:hypothetical protein